MDYLTILGWILNAALMVIVGLIKVVLTKQKEEMKEQQAATKDLVEKVNQVKIDYVHKNDMKDFKEELMKRFDELREDIRSIKQ